jgi:mono/diheme cytochrome c family protein
LGLLAAGAAGCGSAPSAPPPPGPYPRPGYVTLAETGLYDDPSTQAVTKEAAAFEPTYRLWSDGASKRRWVRLPPGTQIDTSDMDHWVLPIGTKLWKEFSLDGTRLETRLVERYGDGPEDYWMGAFVWDADQSAATLAVDGAQDINGTSHDAPSQEKCGACHRGDVGRVLGLSALQMSRPQNAGGDGGLTLAELVARGLLSTPPAAAEPPYAAPGDTTTAAALGYLHANCGHCHNVNGTAWPDTQMVLRLEIGEHDAATSAVYKSLVDRGLQYWRGGAITLRVAAGDPEASAVVARMSTRGTDDQMPPLGTEALDDDGLAAVRAWIAALPARR